MELMDQPLQLDAVESCFIISLFVAVFIDEDSRFDVTMSSCQVGEPKNDLIVYVTPLTCSTWQDVTRPTLTMVPSAGDTC